MSSNRKVILFIKEKLVVEFIVTNSINVLGNGIPLFKQDNPEIIFELQEHKQFGQFVQLHYLAKQRANL